MCTGYCGEGEEEGMKLTIEEIKDYQRKLSEGRGSTININFWNMALANSYPIILKEKDGEVTEIEFLGKKYSIEDH